MSYDSQPVKLLNDFETLDRRYAEIDEALRAAGDAAEQYLPPTLLEAPLDGDDDKVPPAPTEGKRGGLLRRGLRG